jgi:hypothetical protein
LKAFSIYFGLQGEKTLSLGKFFIEKLFALRIKFIFGLQTFSKVKKTDDLSLTLAK